MICNQVDKCMKDTNKPCKRESGCIQHTDERSIVRCEEKRKKYCLNNDLGVRIRKYKMDGGIVKDEQGFDACDNLLVIYAEDATKSVFVELKGSDFKQAVRQIYNCISQYAPMLDKQRTYARIVHTQGVPRIRNSGMLVDLQRAVRSRGGNLKLSEWVLCENVSEMDDI